MTTTAIGPRLGTYADAEQVSGVTRRTLCRYAAAGAIARYSRHTDRRITWFDLDEVAEFFSQHTLVR